MVESCISVIYQELKHKTKQVKGQGLIVKTSSEGVWWEIAPLNVTIVSQTAVQGFLQIHRWRSAISAGNPIVSGFEPLILKFVEEYFPFPSLLTLLEKFSFHWETFQLVP